MIEVEPGVWRLSAPPALGSYRLAQLDDYHRHPRRNFPRRPPASASLCLRASAPILPGTWGFGLWNDPFGFGISPAERRIRLPALPNAAWFFFASPPNHLALADNQPANGWTAGIFCSPKIPPALLIPAAPGLGLLAVRPLARLLRRAATRIVRQESVALAVDVCAWHTYRLEWEERRVRFFVDDDCALTTSEAPRGPLGVVIWIDNQYMRFAPDGRLGVGVVDAAEPGWIEFRDLNLADT